LFHFNIEKNRRDKILSGARFRLPISVHWVGSRERPNDCELIGPLVTELSRPVHADAARQVDSQEVGKPYGTLRATPVTS
jgi:hypothetical protein